MADIHQTVSHGLSEHFAKKAGWPEKQLVKAETFIDTVQRLAAKGEAPSSKDLKAGQSLLRTIQDQTTVFEHTAAVLAGQETVSDADLDKKIAAISKGLERAQITTERLRKTLQSFS